MEDTPLISVILPVYNGEKYLRESIDSILAQTFSNFEFIVINDGSTDSTQSILDSYQGQIRNYDQPNQGLVSALNFGLSMARGEYIARMDADDIALPDRLETEYQFLEKTPEIGIVGTSVYLINEEGKNIGHGKVDTGDLAIRWRSLFRCPFVHPTVMVRRRILEQHHLKYDANYIHVEDYELWIRLLRHTRAANIDTPLLRYRIHKKSVSSIAKSEQQKQHFRVSSQAIATNFPIFSINSSDIHDLCMEVGFPGENNAETRGKRALLSKIFLNLWREFSSMYHQDKDLPLVKHDVVIKAALMILYPPFQKGWLDGIKALSCVDRKWIRLFLPSVAERIMARLQHDQLEQIRR